ncbi:hypothetical protein TcBrA4_0103290 [Trypanosoma cruzi]|nr:hypothetical protein TcBrA4_0103290 [Trypanosoma cruzi]
MAPYTAMEWSLIGNSVAVLVKQRGEIQEQFTHMDEKGKSESMVSDSATISGLRSIPGKHRQILGGFNPYGAHYRSPGTSLTKFRDSSAPAHRVGRPVSWGSSKG